MAYFINSSDVNQTFIMLPSNGFDSTTTVNINGDVQDLSTNREWRVAQGDTGCLTFGGLSYFSPTGITIGAVTGYIVDNETDPATPTYQYISYAGETGKYIPTIDSGIGTFVLLNASGVTFQNTFPTSTERKTNIWLGKVAHPVDVITVVVNEPDYITSPQAFSRDLFQAFNYINDGVYPYANGNNLLMNITNGDIHGNGINFHNDRTNPNMVKMGPISTGATFFYRTQTGGTFSSTTLIEPNVIDINGVATPLVSGSSLTCTIQHIFCIPGAGFVIQYGQKEYPNLASAVSAIGKDSFEVFSNLVNNTVLIGVLVVNRTASDLSDTTKAQFFRADKIGQIIGAAAGTSTTNLQSAYLNSLAPQIVTNPIQGAFQIKGWDGGTANIFQTQDSSGQVTFNIREDGNVTGTSFIKSGGTSNQFLMADGSTSILDISITGTPNTVPKFNVSGSNLTNSNIVDVGTAVTITTDTTMRNITVGRGVNSANFMVGYQNLNPTGTTVGSNNMSIGDWCLNKLTTGTANIAIGGSSLFNNTTGTDNTAIGRFAMYYNTSGTFNVALGGGALQSNRTGTQNMAIGSFALYQMTGGSGNVAVGISALQKQTVGDSNTAIGSSALYNCTTGVRNTAVGALSLYNRLDLPVTGSYNIGVGFQSGRAITSGNNNILIGLELNDGVTSGSNNIILDPINRAGIVTGNNNTIIGGFNGTIPDGSNRIYIGDGSGNIRIAVSSTGNTMIGTTTDTGEKLQVSGTSKFGGTITVNVPSIVGREQILTTQVSDNATDQFGIANGTSVTARFAPVFYNYSNGDYSSLAFRGLTSVIGDTGYTPMVMFQTNLTDSIVNPNNGVFSKPINRPLLGLADFSGTTQFIVNANGNFLINIHSSGDTGQKLQVNGTVKSNQVDLLDSIFGDYKHLTFNSNNLRIVNDNLGVTTNITLPASSTTVSLPATSGTLALTSQLQPILTDVTITGTSFTISADNTRYICTSSAATIATVSSGITGNIEVLQYGFGQVSFVAGAGTTLRYSTFSIPSIAEQYASVGLQKLVSVGEIRLMGELASI